MKKVLLILTVIAMMTLALTGCNQNIGWGSYSYHKVHVQMYGQEATHLKVKSWRDDEGGIEIKTENYGTILLGDGTYMMYDSDNCPLCGNVNYK